MIDHHTDPDEMDPLETQVRKNPNPELIHQHEDVRDPLDIAIIAEHERVYHDQASPVQEGKLNPPPTNEYD